jgi:ribonuclease BN (tRNA processing enzyme)
MKLTFIGSGDAFGNGGRFQTCFLLEQPGIDSVLVDCGATSLTALKAAGKEPNDVTTVLLTHLHGDHFGGVPFLVLDGQFRRRERDLTIAGPPGTRDRVEQAMELLFPGSVGTRRRFGLDFSEIEPGALTSIGPGDVTTIEVEQPGTPACALRVEYGGAVVAYSGDTAWTDDLLGLAEGADLFIAEAYFFDRQVPYHLDHATLKANEARLDCKRIVLTHMSPEMLARTHEAEFDCAHDGMVIELDPTKS